MQEQVVIDLAQIADSVPEDGFNSPQQDTMSTGKPNTAFYMNDKVNFFSGISAA